MKNNFKVILLQIKNSQEKLLYIGKIARFHFKNKKKILFLVSDEKSKKFIDDFLWKIDFLPHDIDNKSDFINISNSIDNSVSSVFNLTQDPIDRFPEDRIYEFDEVLNKQKFLVSKKKFRFYREKGFKIEQH